MRSINIQPLLGEIRLICERWGIVELALFGSVLRDDFSRDSDVDVLVSFASDRHLTIGQSLDLQEELERVFGRKVDLIDRRTVEGSSNYLRRAHILASAESIYVA